MQHEENGCEKVLWPFLETNKVGYTKIQEFVKKTRQVKIIAVNIFFVKKKRKLVYLCTTLKALAYHYWYAYHSLCTTVIKSVRLIRAEKKRTKLCLQTELAEKKSQSLHSQKLPWWAQQIYVTKEKVVTLNAIKMFYVQARNQTGIFWQTQARSETPGLTYNSAPCQKLHSKSSTVLA